MTRSLLGAGAALLLLGGCAEGARSTLILNASVFDGTGAPARQASVRIAGDRIAEVGELAAGPGGSVFDARGLALAPGFIDTHSHADAELAAHPDALAAVSQGITSVIVGQ